MHMAAQDALEMSRRAAPDEPRKSHIAASIDIAGRIAERDAGDLEAATRAIDVCMDTLEFTMLLSSSILALLSDIRSSQLGRKDVDSHLERAIEAFGSIMACSLPSGRVGPSAMPAGACYVDDPFDRYRHLLDSINAAAGRIHELIGHADQQISATVAVLERSREVAVRGVEKTTAAHGLIAQLRERLDKTAGRMRRMSGVLQRAAEQIDERYADAGIAAGAGGRGERLARTLVEDVATGLLSDLETVAREEEAR